MAVAKNCGTTELEEVIGDKVINQVKVLSGGMAIMGSNNVIKADKIELVQHIGLQQKSESAVSGEFKNMRNYRDLHISKLNLELTKNGFHYSGIKAWNDIPVNIRELPSLRVFKIHVKRHLMSLDN